jgi:hypothetical protein
MKTLNLLKWKITAGLALACLSTLSVAQAASITWGAMGTFTDKSVLALAGTVANEVYGVDFGGSGAQTVNGYSFADYATSGNMSIAGGGFGLFGSYMTAAATTTLNDATFNPILTYGLYGGSPNTGTLKNLTVGQAYTVLVLLDDTRGGSAGLSPTFTVLDGVTTSPSQQFEFADGSPSMGGYITGTFTANATTQALTVLNGGSSQYNAILLVKTPPPLVPLPVLVTNTVSAPAAAGVGGQAVFTAAFNISPPVNLQWQIVNDGATNPVTAANAAVVTVTNGGVVSSTLTFGNLQVTNAGSYLLKAVNATNSLGVVYSSAAPLQVAPLIQWLQTGTFTDDTFLALAGTPANEVYGVDFGGTDFQTTANNYTFDDYAGIGNMSVTGNNVQTYGGYLPNGDTGDVGLNTVLEGGIYGGGDMMGTLNNLTVGQTYNVLVILADTRTGPISNPTQVPQTVFYGTDGVSVSPYQPFVYPNATNAIGGSAIGGYVLGKFTAQSTNEPLSVLTADLGGQFGLTAQYNAILVVKSMASSVPPIYLNANTFPVPASSVLPLYFPAQSTYPIPASTLPLAGDPALVAEGTNISFTAAYVGYYAPNNLQWQIITNGVTNNINAGVNIGVVTVTNLGIVTSTLALSNVQLSASGSSYRLKVVNATNSSDVVYSTSYPLIVSATITWGATGTFTDNTVLALAGAVSNEVYGVDFGAGAQTTANNYSFADYVTSGNMSVITTNAGSGAFGGYMGGEGTIATTGDAAFDSVLGNGIYGPGNNTGTLNNLTVGRAYTVLVLLDDTRGGAAGPFSTFTITDGVTTSPSQLFEFTNGTPSVGGYIMGTFTATTTTQALTVNNGESSQYNAILLEKGVLVTPPTPPTLGAPKVSGGNLILSGTGGTPNSGYTWLTTTNLSAPIRWTTNTAGTLDGTGAFSNAIPISATTPASFFRLRLP